MLNGHVQACGLRIDERLGDLLAVGLIATIMLELNVEVERAFRTVDFGAGLVGTREAFLNLACAASVMAFAPVVQVSFGRQLLQVILVESFDLKDVS